MRLRPAVVLSSVLRPRTIGRLAVFAALLILGQAQRAFAEDPMAFEALSSGATAAISAAGHISDRTPQGFLDFLQKNGGARGATVYLDSQGGEVTAAMELGTLFRKLGTTVVVGKASAGLFGGPSIEKGECFSACVYALMGARKRVIPVESAVGIHRMYLSIEGSGDVSAFAPAAQLSAAGRIRAQLSGYAGRMGVSPALIAQAERTRPEEFHILTRAEIQKWHLGTAN